MTQDWKDDNEWQNRLLSDVDPEHPRGGPILWLLIMCSIGITVGAVIGVLALLA